jgi:hypothetical protein
MSGLPFLRVIVIAFACSFAAIAGSARAADVTASLTQASKMMQAGAYVRAIEIITTALSSSKVPAELAAKALLMRAQANEKLGKPAFALADYNQAVWMQGLSDADRKLAEEGRARVQSSLGVRDASEDARDTAAAAAPRRRSAAAQPESSGGVGGFFSNLFGSSQSARREEERPQHAVVAVVQQEAPTGRPAARSHPASGSSWRTNTATPATARVAANTDRPDAEETSGKPSGAFAIQFAALLSEQSAIYEVNRIAKRYGSDLGGRSPEVFIVPTSDGGTLYKIVAGPYERAEGQATCELLKTKNLSCMLISRKQ